jgi:hypothetical protein
MKAELDSVVKLQTIRDRRAGRSREMRVGLKHLRFAGAVEVAGEKKGLRTEC